MSLTDSKPAAVHNRFRKLNDFSEFGYKLMPFRFISFDADRVVMSNLSGQYHLILRKDLKPLLDGTVGQDTKLFEELLAKHFVVSSNSSVAIDLTAIQYRTRKSNLSTFTGLHIFVVTLRCDHSCPYCQVSRVSADRKSFDMTVDTAEKSLEMVFYSPNANIKIEFQGGEPLLNFDLIKSIIGKAEDKNKIYDKNLKFVIATNLSNLTDEMLLFFKDHNVDISTSLDGPEDLHNGNRPRPGNDSYLCAVSGIERCRAQLGHNSVSALMTTTLRSLTRPEEIIDEYIKLKFNSIFLRWLSPFGFAVKSEKHIGYTVSNWETFYEKGIRYCINKCRSGIQIREEYATIILRKLLTPFPCGYVDLQSPAGLGISAVVYNYDGYIYASDEGRMLAERGDYSLRLGNIHSNSYKEILASEKLINLLSTTMTETVPQCIDCAFEPYCGTDPAFHQATQGDPIGHRPTSSFCSRNMFVIRLLIKILEDEKDSSEVLRSWAFQ